MWWLVWGLMACKTEEPVVDTDPVPTIDTDDTDDGRGIPPVTAGRMTVKGHAQECQQALGPIPGFDCVEDAVPMPVFRDGLPMTADFGECDKPSLLEGSCNRFTRLGRKTGTWMNGEERPEVTFVFTCRSYDFQAPDERGGLYHDVAMIGHNAETGATCFFQSFPEGQVRYFPSPLTAGETPDLGEVDAREIWDRPADTAGINCHRCHGADPWIHSPWIDQVEDPDTPGEPIVPWTEIGSPYHVVGTAFSDWRLTHVVPEDNACLTCHRMNPGQDPENFIRYSIGEDVGMPLTTHITNWPESHWMPPAGAADVASWEAEWRTHVDALLECVETPNAESCHRQPVPEGDRYIDPEAPPRDTGPVDSGLFPDTALQCATPDADLGRALGVLTMGNTCGQGHDYVRSCGAYGSDGEDMGFLWAAPSDGTFTFTTVGSDFDTTLSARTDCAAGNDELACNDDTVDVQSEISLTLTEGQRVVLVVDTYEGPECGDFVLNAAAE